MINEPLPSEEPEEVVPEELEVEGVIEVKHIFDDNDDILPTNEDGQNTLF